MTTRRDFLKGLGMGAVALAPGAALVPEAAPVVTEALMVDQMERRIQNMLEDAIYQITPLDTPMLDLRWGAGRGVHAWVVDRLPTAEESRSITLRSEHAGMTVAEVFEAEFGGGS